MTGLGVLSGLCGAAVAAGLLLIVAGVRPVPVETRRPDWSAGRARVRRLVHRRRLVLAAVTTGIVAWWVTSWPVAALATAAVVVGFPRLVSGSGGRAQLARLEALEVWTRRLADLLGSGAGGLEQAIAMSVRTCPAPIATEVSALAARIRVLGAEAALRAFADDLADVGSPAADLAAAALILRVRRGGRGLRPVLEALAADVAELVRARRAVEADRAKPRSNVRALVAVTAVVLTATVLFAREYLHPFTTPLGQLMLALITAVFAAAVVLLTRITRQPPTPRFLPAAPAAEPRGSDPQLGMGAWWT